MTVAALKTPENMLKTDILYCKSLEDVVIRLSSYPFMMQNQKGESFKPQDLIDHIETYKQSPEHLLNTSMIDGKYGLQQKIQSLNAPTQSQSLKTQKLFTNPEAKQTSSMAHRREQLRQRLEAAASSTPSNSASIKSKK